MAITLKFPRARRTPSVVSLGAKALASISVAACALLFSGVSLAQQAPQQAQAGPGTAVVEPGVRARRLVRKENWSAVSPPV